MRNSPPLAVDARDAEILRSWIENEPAGAAGSRRARIVLLSGTGLGPSAIADEVGCSKQMVITWRERYRSAGIDGLRDAPRSGRPATVDAGAVIRRTLEEPPGRLRTARWSTRLLAAELGISNAAVANVWRTWGVVPGPGGGVRLGTDPPFALPISAVAGLYADSSVRVLALRIGADGRARWPVVPVAQRPCVGAGIADIDPGAGASDGLMSFLGRLEPAGPHRLGLLVDACGPDLGTWRDARPDASVYVVGPALSWDRPVRVACLLAGATARGAASVQELRRALDARSAGESVAIHLQ